MDIKFTESERKLNSLAKTYEILQNKHHNFKINSKFKLNYRSKEIAPGIKFLFFRTTEICNSFMKKF